MFYSECNIRCLFGLLFLIKVYEHFHGALKFVIYEILFKDYCHIKKCSQIWWKDTSYRLHLWRCPLHVCCKECGECITAAGYNYYWCELADRDIGYVTGYCSPRPYEWQMCENLCHYIIMQILCTHFLLAFHRVQKLGEGTALRTLGRLKDVKSDLLQPQKNPLLPLLHLFIASSIVAIQNMRFER